MNLESVRDPLRNKIIIFKQQGLKSNVDRSEIHSKTLYDTIAAKTSINLSQSEQGLKTTNDILNFQNKSNPNIPIIKNN